MESSSSNFVELEWSELAEIVEELVQHHSEVKLWKRGEAPDLCRIVNGHLEEEGDKSHELRLEANNIQKNWEGQDYFIQFEWNGVEYFSKGKVSEVPSNGECWLTMNPHVFRVEKRENERVTTFPSMQVYAYFKISGDSEPENLVFINKHIEESHSVFKKFEQLTKQEIIDYQDSMESDKSEEIIGFRVLDLSRNGLSFFTNQNESTLFGEKQPYEFTLLFEGKVFHISNAQVIYNVNYVNPRAGSVPMFKVGLSFDPNPKLSQEVRTQLNNREQNDKILKDFENFAE